MLEEVAPGDALDASLKPDGDLGVTLLAITSIGEDSQYVLDAAAQSAAAACFVEELCDSMAGDVSGNPEYDAAFALGSRQTR